MSRFEPKVRWWSARSRSPSKFAQGRHTHGRRRLGMDCLEDRTLLSQPGTWAAVAPLPTTRVYLGSATLDGIIYAVGGDTGGGGDPRTSEVDAYNPQSNQWTQVAPLPEPTMSLAAVADNGLMYAIGGQNSNSQVYNQVESYNPQTNSWSQVAPLPTARAYLGAAVSSTGIIYAVGGDTNPINASDYASGTNEVDAYNPYDNTWTVVAPLPIDLHCPAVTAGPNGEIIVMGGGFCQGNNPISRQFLLTTPKPMLGQVMLLCQSEIIIPPLRPVTMAPFTLSVVPGVTMPSIPMIPKPTSGPL